MREVGIASTEVVTDGSALYLEVIAKVWSKAVHQLCLFHVTRRLLMTVLSVVPEVRAALPNLPHGEGHKGPVPRRADPIGPSPHDRDARIALVQRLHREGLLIREITRTTGHSRNTIRSWLRGIVTPKTVRESLAEVTMRHVLQPLPPPPPEWKSWDEVRAFRERLNAHLYLLLAGLSNLSNPDWAELHELISPPAAKVLRVAHRWVQDWCAIWHNEDGRRRTWEQAHQRFVAWQNDQEAGSVDALAKVKAKMSDERFTGLSQFLRNPAWEAASNGAERAGRGLRHHRTSHFNLRSVAAIKAMLDVTSNARRNRDTTNSFGVGRSTRGRRVETKCAKLAAA